MKYLFLDVDGTLIDYKTKLPASAKKAVEQAQISVFLDTLHLHGAFKELCGLEFISGAANVLSKEETELSQVRHDKYADMNNNLVYELLVNMAIELLTDNEILDVILNV